jgi:hypothetical protein
MLAGNPASQSLGDHRAGIAKYGNNDEKHSPGVELTLKGHVVEHSTERRHKGQQNVLHKQGKEHAESHDDFLGPPTQAANQGK